VKEENTLKGPGIREPAYDRPGQPLSAESRSDIIRTKGPSPRSIDTGPLRPERGGTSEPLNTVSVPKPLNNIFLRAQDYVERYFSGKEENPHCGLIEISGERYILVRAASMSKEFFDLVSSLYRDRGETEARTVASGFLFDMAHAIGKADAGNFSSRMGVDDPLEKLSAGPIHFAYTGWAFVKIFPESNPTPDEDYYLIYDHPFSFEAHTWLKGGVKTDFPVCVMNAGYSSGWCEESFGIPLVAFEIECKAKGDEHCRFIMAPPSKIEEYITRYTAHASAQSFGKTVEGAIGLNAFGLLPPDIARRRKEYHDRAVRSGDSLRYEDERDGRWMDTTIDPICDAKGKVARIAVVSRDMTEYKEMQEALRKEKEFNANLINTSPALFVAIGADGRTLLMNEALLKALGYTRSEVIGKNYLHTFAPKAEWHSLHDAFQSIPGNGTTRVIESRLVTKDDRQLTVEWHSRHVMKKNGELDYFFALGLDISERKRAEEELRRHRDHLEDIVKERAKKLMEIMEDLRKREAQMKRQSRRLEEANTALRVVLKQMEEKRREDRENILSNVKQLIIPYLNRLKGGPLNRDQMILLGTLESNLNGITSPLVGKLSSSFLRLTPMEIRIAHLVKEGLMNKEIAELLGTSLNTISSHRHSIRGKLGLKNKGMNLRSYLLSLEE
jgi:PAS domain S-box-containing protein